MATHQPARSGGAATSNIIGNPAPGVKRCAECGASFTPIKSRKRIYCTDACGAARHERARADRERIKRAKNQIKRPCEHCGASFAPLTKSKRYCSGKCARDHLNQVRNDLRAAERVTRPPRDAVIRTCRRPECSIEFEATTTRKRFCSQRCAKIVWIRANTYTEEDRLHIRCQATGCSRKLTGRVDRHYCSPRCTQRAYASGKRRKAAA